jgi:23S rRNA (adenine2503-C2)-methyltransferase
MGMGEPMDNLDAVLEAVRLLTQRPVPGLSPNHITVSTAGVVPAIRRFLSESDACLALSLNATTDAQREELMPHNRLWPIAELMKTLREHGGERDIFIEYVLFDGKNDSDADADRLVALLEGVRSRVNVIPFNGHPVSDLRPPSDVRAVEFQKRVSGAGLRCMVRWPRGRDIDAACGQLALRTSPLSP